MILSRFEADLNNYSLSYSKVFWHWSCFYWNFVWFCSYHPGARVYCWLIDSWYSSLLLHTRTVCVLECAKLIAPLFLLNLSIFCLAHSENLGNEVDVVGRKHVKVNVLMISGKAAFRSRASWNRRIVRLILVEFYWLDMRRIRPKCLHIPNRWSHNFFQRIRGSDDQSSSSRTGEKKATECVVKSTDMPEEMQRAAMQVAVDAMSKYRVEKVYGVEWKML